jgi:hypothetical protein
VLAWLDLYREELFFVQQRLSDEQVGAVTPRQAEDGIRLLPRMGQGNRVFTLLAPLAPVRSHCWLQLAKLLRKWLWCFRETTSAPLSPVRCHVALTE